MVVVPLPLPVYMNKLYILSNMNKLSTLSYMNKLILLRNKFDVE